MRLRTLALTLLVLPGPLCGAARDRAPRPVALEGARNLASFFKRLRPLEAGRPGLVPVLQFGDSHTAADLWTGQLRRRFQARFGDAGPGLLLPARPWRGYPHPGVREAFNHAWPASSLREREGDGLVGLAGAALSLADGESYRIEAPFRSFAVDTLGPPEDAPGLDLPGPLQATDLAQVGPLVLRSYTPPPEFDGAAGLAITLPETSRLLGVDLRSGRPGILYQELGLNGAELFDLERWNPELRRALLAQAAPGLLVLAYGTNDLGRGDLDPADYRARAAALFARLKAEAGCPILVVGPVDRGAKLRRQLPALRAGARIVVESLRLAARDARCAFWDARAAMGGAGTMAKWRRLGLAQNDLVHLTGAGYARLGDLQFGALMKAYESYCGTM